MDETKKQEQKEERKSKPQAKPAQKKSATPPKKNADKEKIADMAATIDDLRKQIDEVKKERDAAKAQAAQAQSMTKPPVRDIRITFLADADTAQRLERVVESAQAKAKKEGRKRYSRNDWLADVVTDMADGGR